MVKDAELFDANRNLFFKQGYFCGSATLLLLWAKSICNEFTVHRIEANHRDTLRQEYPIENVE